MIEAKLKELKQAKEAKAILLADMGKVNETIERLSNEIVEEFEARKIKSMKLKDVGNFITVVKSYPKVINPVALREWMLKNNFAWDIVLAFNASKFKGFYRELLDNKKPLPDGCENYTEASITVKKYVG